MAMHGDSDMHVSRETAAGGAQPALVLNGCGTIGLHLATVLLEAGYTVYGMNVADCCQQAFLRAGGQLMTCGRRTLRSAAWIIECAEQEHPAPEVVSRIGAFRSGYGRPRVELAGTHRSPHGQPAPAIAELTLRLASVPGASLAVELGVSYRGPELTVRGDRPLFERALPLLTTIADRVVYTATDSDCPC